MRAFKVIFLVVGIPVFFFCLELFSVGAFGGAGDGDFYFADAVSAPFTNFNSTGHGDFVRSFGVILWPTVAILLAFRRFRGCRCAAAIILILHYCGVAKLGFDYSWSYAVGKAWSAGPVVLAFVLAAYFFIQTFMWWLLVRQQILHNHSLEPSAVAAISSALRSMPRVGGGSGPGR